MAKEHLRRHSHGTPAQWIQGPRPFPLVGNFSSRTGSEGKMSHSEKFGKNFLSDSAVPPLPLQGSTASDFPINWGLA